MYGGWMETCYKRGCKELATIRAGWLDSDSEMHWVEGCWNHAEQHVKGKPITTRALLMTITDAALEAIPTS